MHNNQTRAEVLVLVRSRKKLSEQAKSIELAQFVSARELAINTLYMYKNTHICISCVFVYIYIYVYVIHNNKIIIKNKE